MFASVKPSAATVHLTVAFNYSIPLPGSKNADTQMGVCIFGTIVLIGLGEKVKNTNGFCNQITAHSPLIRYITSLKLHDI